MGVARTARRDVELGGTQIRKGDRIFALIPSGNLDPAPGPQTPHLAFDGCMASDPNTPKCTYDAKQAAGMGGSSGAPGGWTVTIDRPSESR